MKLHRHRTALGPAALAILLALGPAQQPAAQEPEGEAPVGPPAPEMLPQSDDMQEEIAKLFQQVELNLMRIDTMLNDAGAGDILLEDVADAGLDDLLRETKSSSQSVVSDIDRILEIAQQQGGGSMSQAMQKPSGESPLDQPRDRGPQGREQTPEQPGQDQQQGKKPQDGQKPESPEGSDDPGQTRPGDPFDPERGDPFAVDPRRRGLGCPAGAHAGDLPQRGLRRPAGAVPRLDRRLLPASEPRPALRRCGSRRCCWWPGSAPSLRPFRATRTASVPGRPPAAPSRPRASRSCRGCPPVPTPSAAPPSSAPSTSSLPRRPRTRTGPFPARRPTSGPPSASPPSGRWPSWPAAAPPAAGPHGRETALVIDYLLAHVDLAQGSKQYGYISNQGDTLSRMHGHGFATLALAEAYGMAPRSERLEKALRAAVAVIESSQSPEGGWHYAPRPVNHEGSVTICLVQALRAAHNAGVRVDPAVIVRAEDYVMALKNEAGLFRYQLDRQDASVGLTAAAITTLNMAGRYDSSVIRESVDAIWSGLELRRESGGYSKFPLYERLYLAQALLAALRPEPLRALVRGGDPARPAHPALGRQLGQPLRAELWGGGERAGAGAAGRAAAHPAALGAMGAAVAPRGHEQLGLRVHRDARGVAAGREGEAQQAERHALGVDDGPRRRGRDC